jgi:hypothetical protein
MALIELTDPQAQVELRLHLEGNAFEKGIPVHLLIQGFQASQSILDRAYLGLAEKNRLTAEERRHFYLSSRGVKHSSLDSVVDVVLSGVQATFPILGALGPSGIWEHAKSAYELLKFVYEATKRGEQPTYQNNGDGTISVNNGTQINVYNGPVYNIAKLSQNNYNDLASHVLNDSIRSFSLSDGAAGGGILMAQNEAAYFDLPSTIETEQLELECEIFDFNKFEDTGKLRVVDGQALPSKDYRFSVVGNQADVTYIEAMLRKTVKVTCLKEIKSDPLAQEKIVRLQVLKVA